MEKRFQDQNHRLSFFRTKVKVECPECSKDALATVDDDEKKARLFCVHCGYSKILSTEVSVVGIRGNSQRAAHEYFGARLWYEAPFRNEVFQAYNMEHLLYLEAYISATLREHKDRSHFTLLEKLPRFYHEAKNRDSLLKVIAKLKNKK